MIANPVANFLLKIKKGQLPNHRQYRVAVSPRQGKVKGLLKENKFDVFVFICC